MGLTEIDGPVCPVLHKYEYEPEAVIMAVSPVQTDETFEDKLNTGGAVIIVDKVSITLLVSVQIHVTVFLIWVIIK